MFGSLSNLIFILIPLAVFIGRIVVQARSKREPPPRIPVHFEDDDSELFEPHVKDTPLNYKDALKAALKSGSSSFGSTVVRKDLKFDSPKEFDHAPVTFPSVRVDVPAPPKQKEFTLKLDHLSPMQQAVVLAEVLGPPKALL
jgi:hypothetical protein